MIHAVKLYADEIWLMRNLDQIMRAEVNVTHGSDSALYSSSGFVLENSSLSAIIPLLADYAS